MSETLGHFDYLRKFSIKCSFIDLIIQCSEWFQHRAHTCNLNQPHVIFLIKQNFKLHFVYEDGITVWEIQCVIVCSRIWPEVVNV